MLDTVPDTWDSVVVSQPVGVRDIAVMDLRTRYRLAGVIILAAGLTGLWAELGRRQVVQGDAIIGGPDPQALLLFAVVTVAGATIAAWNMVRRGPDQ